MRKGKVGSRRKGQCVVTRKGRQNPPKLRYTHRICLVPDEVDLLKTFILDVLECIGLVPAPREDVERDLAADGVREVVFREFFLEDLDEFAANLALLIIFDRTCRCLECGAIG